MQEHTNTCPDWRPPAWQNEKPSETDKTDMSPDGIAKLHATYKAKGYYRSGARLSEKGAQKNDAEVALMVAHNHACLNDSWNTPAWVWELAAHITGCMTSSGQPAFKVDPFWNPGVNGLPALKSKLDGVGDQADDMRESNGFAVDEAGFPINWRGKMKKGHAPAAVNGPHSNIVSWLKLCQAYGQEEICASFVIDGGDAWFTNIGMTATLVVRLSRVACHPPPGLTASSPRAANALLIWIPPSVDVKTLPKPTQGALKGRSFKTPLRALARGGYAWASVQAGNMRKTVDFFDVLPK